jgi:XRE family aerobic/anaerobic benzoate catabolism transcriptional regulator
MTKTRKVKSADRAIRNSDVRDFLVAMGQRVRALRDRACITRKALSLATGISERHLANLEYGEGNVSVLVLLDVATALHCSLAELIGDFTTTSPEGMRIRSLLEKRDEQTLHQVRVAIGQQLGTAVAGSSSSTRIALIGLRGAGKSTLGKMLAQDLGFPFIELSREIEQLAGCTIAELQDLYGSNAYRRYERQALEETIQIHPTAIIGTPGGLVSDAVNYNLLLTNCTAIWLQAKPEDHMQRVIEQGDFRPMAGASEAMQDLKDILSAREEFYSKAGLRLDTSKQLLQPTFLLLRNLVRDFLQTNAATINAV